MISQQVIDEISGRINDVLASSPARDMEKNMRAMLGSLFARLELVTREEFDVQREVLQRTRQKLAELEARVAELEQESPAGPRG